MNQIMRDKTIQFLINEKDNLVNDIEDYVFPDINYTYQPLTQGEIDEINNLRKQIFDVYKIIDKIGEIDK